MEKKSYLHEVKKQYEDYPYPERIPEAEKGVLLSSKAASLDCINHYCFAGNKELTENFRVLIPGGGTGDCAIYLAEQLRDTSAEVVYLDMSLSSLNIAQKRAEVRQLDNIQWIHDSILNISKLNIGKFDFISCTGVLHHLSNPGAGLAQLKSVLAENGSIFLMLYGQYGRTAIYQIQDLMRRINADTPDVRQKILNTKKLLKSLPETNWLKFNENSFSYDMSSDIGLYDLFLHSQDRAYSIPELYCLVESQGLKVDTMFEPDHPLGAMIFEPKTFIKDSSLLSDICKLPKVEQQAICELTFGQQFKHSCFISLKGKDPARLDNHSLVPVHGISGARNKSKEKLRDAFNDVQPKIKINNCVDIIRRPMTKDLYNAIDGKNCIAEILKHTQSLWPNESLHEILAQFNRLFEVLNKLGLVFLKEPTIKRYPSIPEMQDRILSIYGKEECYKIYQKYYN